MSVMSSTAVDPKSFSLLFPITFHSQAQECETQDKEAVPGGYIPKERKGNVESCLTGGLLQINDSRVAGQPLLLTKLHFSKMNLFSKRWKRK